MVNIIKIGPAKCNVWLIMNGEKSILVDAGYLEQGFGPLPRGTSWYSAIISWLGRNFMYGMGKFQSVSPDITLKEKLDLERYGMEGYIIPTPGHTSGSQSLIIGEHAFIGDDMFGIFRNTVLPPFADDMPSLLKSWEEILDTGCKMFYPGHGRVIERPRIEDELRKRRKEFEGTNLSD